MSTKLEETKNQFITVINSRQYTSETAILGGFLIYSVSVRQCGVVELTFHKLTSLITVTFCRQPPSATAEKL